MTGGRTKCQDECSERNGRDFQLLLQNLKGAFNVCVSNDVFCTLDVVEESTQQLQELYTSLTLIEHEVSAQFEQSRYSSPEHMHHFKSYGLNAKPIIRLI